MTEPSSRPGRLLIQLVGLTILLAFVPVEVDAGRTGIRRRLPETDGFRPAGPFRSGSVMDPCDSIVFRAPPSGSTSLIIGADSAEAAANEYHLDNIFVVRKDRFLSSTCGPGNVFDCSIRNSGCIDDGIVQTLVFDQASPEPLSSDFPVFETFQTGIPASWILDGACWDGAATAPTSIGATGSTGSSACGFIAAGGSLALAAASCPAGSAEATVTIPMTGLDPGEDYIVNLWWGPEDGNGFIPEEAELFYEFVDGPRLLLVDDDDNAPDVRSFYTDLLDTFCIPYDVHDTANSDVAEPTAGTLAAYDRVIWFSGDAFGGPAGPGAAGEAALGSFLDAGGCLLLSSQNYFEDHGFTSFMQNRLGVSSVIEGGDYTRVDVAGPFSEVNQGFLSSTVSGPWDLHDPGPGNGFDTGPWSDFPVPGLGTQTVFRSCVVSDCTTTVGVARAAGESHTSYLGFPLEAIEGNDFTYSDSRDFMLSFLCWCDSDVPLFRDGFESGDVAAW